MDEKTHFGSVALGLVVTQGSWHIVIGTSCPNFKPFNYYFFVLKIIFVIYF